MTSHAVQPAPAPARKTSGWWALFLFVLFGLGIPAVLAVLARLALDG